MIMSEIEKFRQLQEQKRNENDMKHRMAIRVGTAILALNFDGCRKN